MEVYPEDICELFLNLMGHMSDMMGNMMGNMGNLMCQTTFNVVQ